MLLLSTALFFPDYPSGIPLNMYLLLFFFITIFIPFMMIFNVARN